MALDVAYALNGMPLDADCMHVTVGSTFLAGISARRTVTTVPGRHGSIPTGMPPRYEERQLTVRVLTHDAGSDAMARRFLHLCTMPALVMTRTMHAMYGGDESLPDQTTGVELTSLQPDGDERPYGTRRSMTAVFAMPDVFWRGTPIVRPVDAQGRILPGVVDPPKAGYWTRWEGEPDNSVSDLADFYTMWTGMPDDSTSILFDRLSDGWMGDAPITDPIIRVTNPTHLTITDPVSRTDLTWSGNANGQYLYLDPLHLHAWLATDDGAWTGGTNINGLDWTREPLEIWPANDNTYSLSIDSDGTNPTVRFSPTWW